MQYEDSESEESSEEEYDQEDPLAVLYSFVRHYKSGTLAEPFLQLPSKREHPDYYLTIGDPISLNEVWNITPTQPPHNLQINIYKITYTRITKTLFVLDSKKT